MTFEELRLAEPLLRALAAEGYTTPTPIQEKAIPHVLAGSDLLGCAQTGTGKTAAFALPTLQRLMAKHAGEAHAPHRDQADSHHGTPAPHGGHGARSHGAHASQASHAGRPGRPVRALILAPTRELAAQIGDSFRAYGRHTGLRHTVIFGGVGQNPQVRALRDGVDILVATPGRLMDLMNQGFVNLKQVEVFILDEADRMLDMGFIPDIRRIVSHIPATGKRQTLMFSATMPPEVRELTHSLLHKPVNVQVAAESATADRIGQSVFFVEQRNKPELLVHLLQTESLTRALVFTRTKHGADRVARQLFRAGIGAEAIHGNKSQNARQRALENFRSGKTAVLIASDIAARGIDIDEISHVINFDLPNVPETYVHRIGRTARAGASGVAISFCDHSERPHLKSIERLTRVPVPVREDQPKYSMKAESRSEFREDNRQGRSGQGGHGGHGGHGGRGGHGGGDGGRGGQGGRGGGHRSRSGYGGHSGQSGRPGTGVRRDQAGQGAHAAQPAAQPPRHNAPRHDNAAHSHAGKPSESHSHAAHSTHASHTKPAHAPTHAKPAPTHSHAQATHSPAAQAAHQQGHAPGHAPGHGNGGKPRFQSHRDKRV